jgi:hypothetical protein
MAMRRNVGTSEEENGIEEKMNISREEKYRKSVRKAAPRKKSGMKMKALAMLKTNALKMAH